jgi:hypothetical protein
MMQVVQSCLHESRGAADVAMVGHRYYLNENALQFVATMVCSLLAVLQ